MGNPSNPNRAFSPGTGVRGTMGNVLGAIQGSSSSSSSSGAGEVAFPNLIWVNASASAGGTGSVNLPFQTPSEGVNAIPVGGSGTILLAPGDYSATPAIDIAGRNVTFECLGGVQTGVLTPRARAVMPAIRFIASAGTLLFTAAQCEFGTLTVQTAIDATLFNCSSSWIDAGGLATVRSIGEPETFLGSPQQTISGSINSALLYGMRVQSLSGANIIATRGRLVAGGAGIVASANAAFYDHEFDAGGVIASAPTGLFLDQWSWFQANEAGVNFVAAAPAVSVQELSPLQWQWGAFVYNVNQYLNPWANFGTAQAAPTGEWIAVERNCFASDIHVQIATALANPLEVTLFTGATIAGVAATTLKATVPAGQLFADFGLTTPVKLARGQFATAKVTTLAVAVAAGPSCQVRVSAF